MLYTILRLFKRMAHVKHFFFLKLIPQDLHADRQTFFTESGRNREAGQAADAGGNRQGIGRIHGQRVFHFFTDLKRRERRGGRDQRVTLFKYLFIFLFHQSTHFGRL